MTEDEAYKITRPFMARNFAGKPGKPHDPAQCCASIHSGFYGHQCDKKPKYWHGTLGYCGIHDPEKVNARREKQNAKWRADSAANKAKWAKETRQREMRAECVVAVWEIAVGNPTAVDQCRQIATKYEDLMRP